MNYLIKFTVKRDLRLLLRHNSIQDTRRSSLYKIADFYYIALDAETKLTIPYHLPIQIVEHADGAEEYMFNWARSEIMQSLDYIQFEQNSSLTKNGRLADYYGIPVCRSFEQVADIFAILNYTPDSFSDGGKFNQIDNALKQVEYLCHSGADVIDLGVESTRPTLKQPLSAEMEIKRLQQILPHVLQLKSELNFALSIDTYHNETMRWLADFAVDIINDVSGNTSLEIVKTILESDKRYVAMHSLSIPANPDMILDKHINPVNHLKDWMLNKLDAIVDAGCKSSNLILDPGIGFGMSPAQAWFVVRNIKQLCNLPCEILIGHSRKVFFNHITEKPFGERDLETALVAAKVLPYVDYLRLHDLQYFKQANLVFNQLG